MLTTDDNVAKLITAMMAALADRFGSVRHSQHSSCCYHLDLSVHVNGYRRGVHHNRDLAVRYTRRGQDGGKTCGGCKPGQSEALSAELTVRSQGRTDKGHENETHKRQIVLDDVAKNCGHVACGHDGQVIRLLRVRRLTETEQDVYSEDKDTSSSAQKDTTGHWVADLAEAEAVVAEILALAAEMPDGAINEDMESEEDAGYDEDSLS